MGLYNELPAVAPKVLRPDESVLDLITAIFGVPAGGNTFASYLAAIATGSPAGDMIEGKAAVGGAPVGNPVWIGGIGADGQIHALLLTNAGALQIAEADGANVALGASTDADTVASVLGRLLKTVHLLAGGLPAALGQGTMAQSLRVVLPSDQSALAILPPAPTEGVLLASAAHMGAQTVAGPANTKFHGLMLFVEVVTNADSVALDFAIQTQAAGMTGWVPLASWSPMGTWAGPTGVALATIYPGATTVSLYDGALPATWRVVVTTSDDTKNVTYSLTYCLLP